MSSIAGLKEYFHNTKQNPAVTPWELLAVVDGFRNELHEELASESAITSVDHGGPITLRCEAIDTID